MIVIEARNNAYQICCYEETSAGEKTLSAKFQKKNCEYLLPLLQDLQILLTVSQLLESKVSPDISYDNKSHWIDKVDQ